MHKNIDEKMLLTFYRFACEHSKFMETAYFVSKYSQYVFFAIYFGSGLYLLSARSPSIILFITVPLINLIISYSVRAAIKRERPYVMLDLQTPYEKKQSYSFPSNHSASASIIAFSCLSVNNYLGTAVFMLAIITGLSRLFLAAHYPSDIVFGFIQSVVVAAIGFNIIPLFLL